GIGGRIPRAPAAQRHRGSAPRRHRGRAAREHGPAHRDRPGRCRAGGAGAIAMDLALTESQEILKTSARSFMAREAPKDVIVGLEQAESGLLPELWRKACEIGWL